MDTDQLAANEPLSPELVLVLPAELRAQVLASLGPPVRPRPRARVRPAPAAVPTPADDPFASSLAKVLVARVAQLAAIFVLVTILVLAMTLVANATQSEKRPQMTPIRAPIDKAAKAGRSGRSASLVGRYREGTWKPA